jgi:glycosyltransferase involved in cell wall biosynthesis
VRGRVPREELAELLPDCFGSRVPEPIRGVRQAAARGDGVGHPRGGVPRAGSLPEVCGDAAFYFDPTSTKELAEAILAVLERPDHLVQRGLARTSRFTWDATARRHYEVYRALAA